TFLFFIPVLQQWALIVGYFIVGLGAVIFSPAKYGLLPELLEEKKLVKVNSWLEGATILAILMGQVAGATLGQQSINLGLFVVVALYAVSAVLSYGIELTPIVKTSLTNPFKAFKQDLRFLLKNNYTRFALFGVSLFWAIAAVLQLLLFEWSALVLDIKDEVEISKFGLAISIGIIIGALIVPRLIDLKTLRRVRYAAFGMGLFVVLLSFANSIVMTYLLLLCIGFCGGLLVVPINAALEDVGHQTLGSGAAVAVQRFLENISMALALVVYTLVLSLDVSAIYIMLSLGLIIFAVTLCISSQLPEQPFTVE
ncbi:MFS transporter, partial [Beggiatoa alba]|nr:MFS transporter [Beggiatoa alba]